eukprot:4435812-Pyramimonas_sp.AAC.1
MAADEAAAGGGGGGEGGAAARVPGRGDAGPTHAAGFGGAESFVHRPRAPLAPAQRGPGREHHHQAVQAPPRVLGPVPGGAARGRGAHASQHHHARRPTAEGHPAGSRHAPARSAQGDDNRKRLLHK